jgi:hypothetical protein
MSRRVTRAQLPFSNAVLHAHKSKVMSGNGMGSVLLSKGGPGSASSYMDMDDYIAQTGNNPLARAKKSSPSTGTGVASKLSGLSSKLSKLSVDTSDKPKRKNIVMSM